ncbi:autocrine proliferation repressor protein A-like [Rhineura floridana]|uniref:autocrine proliferation repressor protein A-like n=1 Tax=Rhineura floridana TaxID=261503 RepID=UPI002AC7EADB|nr:autocrine proliferation repressor protein A-like [Rhineura floridana]
MYAVLPLLLLTACLPSGWMVEQKALDVYVQQRDPHYSYTIKKKEDSPDVTVYTLKMTSLKWLDDSEVDTTVWWHELFIVMPKNQQMKDSCLLMIGNGRNDAVFQPVDLNVNEAINAAKSTGFCTALVRQIPNQPITFRKLVMHECKNSIEDYAVFCSWRKFIIDKSAKPDVLIQFPMVKATVRALDTITELLQKESDGKVNIRRFTLTGGSKRGWTSWLTAAVDKRVVSFSPIVFDLLNIIKNLHHQYRAYCGWTYAMWAIDDLKITHKLDTPQLQKLTSYVDPLAYNDRYLNKPKYLIIVTGDEFFPLDDSHSFFHQLAGEKYFWAIPNSDHLVTLDPGTRISIAKSLTTFFVSTMLNLKMPNISWKKTETNATGTIYLYTDQEPSAAKCFFANTLGSKRRDFRLFMGPSSPGLLQDVFWFPCGVEKVETGVYKAELEKPLTGWKGFLIEVTFPGPGNNDYVFTSEVHIIPDTFPCEDCKEIQCYGNVV